jgi:hypothetical protein
VTVFACVPAALAGSGGARQAADRPISRCEGGWSLFSSVRVVMHASIRTGGEQCVTAHACAHPTAAALAGSTNTKRGVGPDTPDKVAGSACVLWWSHGVFE